MSDEIINPEGQNPAAIQPVGTNDLVSLNESIQRLETTQARMLETIAGLYEISRREYSQGILARIKDVEMPFGSMVVFMIKWAIAAIPAAIILLIFGAVIWLLVTLVFGGLLFGLSNL
jgi:hypothetical protein